MANLIRELTKINIDIQERNGGVDMCKAWAQQKENGRQSGVEKMARLNRILISEKRFEDLSKASEDGQYRQRLFVEYGIE